LGATALADGCEELEARARERALDGADELFERIEVEFERAERTLETVRREV
jgi:HPt (histidine-containing phosphotransfer) domain-containing protein